MDGKYKRILLKMSGEALGGETGRGIDFDFTGEVCKAVKQCVDAGVQVSVADHVTDHALTSSLIMH